MRPLPPPAHDRPSPPLAAQIGRDFGSMEDFRRALHTMTSDPRRGGCVSLVCTPDGRLRLVHTPPSAPPPRGEVLLRFPCPPGARPPRPDWRDASERFDRHMGRRPPYPTP